MKAHTSTYDMKAVNDIQGTKADNWARGLYTLGGGGVERRGAGVTFFFGEGRG
jgi:hypothetical protein